MRYFIFFAILFLSGLFACRNETDNDLPLQNRIDSLEKELADTYKPGLGEFMTEIQIHHAKLWFAGQYQNWKLAEFETGEIEESLAGIKKYCQDRPEIKLIGMIDQPMDSIIKSVQRRNSVQFDRNFISLTNTCNSCHQSTNHEYNVIKIPDIPPFSNQDFKVHEPK